MSISRFLLLTACSLMLASTLLQADTPDTTADDFHWMSKASLTLALNATEANGESDFLINDAISDTWYDPATAGQGFQIIVWEDSQFMFIAWYTFDTERPPEDVTAIIGEPGHRWITAQGPYEGDTATLEASLTSGGVFDSGQPRTRTDEDGTIEITFSDCNAGVVNYDITSAGVQGSIDIERVVLGNVPDCQAAQPASAR